MHTDTPEAHETSRRGFFKSSIAELRYNAENSMPWLAFDAIMLVACAALFFANSNVLIELANEYAPGSPVAYVATCHLNDLFGGLAFMCYTNLLIDLVKPEVRFKRLSSILVFILLCGLFWEFVAPAFVEDSVSDPLDIAAYALGGFLYWLFTKACQHSAMVNERAR